REPDAPRRWQYTRRLALTPGRLKGLHEYGWQDCGRWGVFHYLKRTTEDFDVSDDDNKRERVAGRTKDPRSVALALMLGIVSLIVAVLEVGLVPAPAWEKAIGLVVAVALAAVAVGVYLRA
ncbi:MAG: hypothetical protein LBJ87_11410, partial [bacterium]|nr:hypothetical protein [bacterium]